LSFTLAEKDAFLGVMRTIADEYGALTNKRNDLLHATWYIGFTDASDPDSSEFHIRKFTTSKHGLSRVELPKIIKTMRYSEKLGCVAS
jgi:hypothetical protein